MGGGRRSRRSQLFSGRLEVSHCFLQSRYFYRDLGRGLGRGGLGRRPYDGRPYRRRNRRWRASRGVANKRHVPTSGNQQRYDGDHPPREVTPPSPFGWPKQPALLRANKNLLAPGGLSGYRRRYACGGCRGWNNCSWSPDIDVSWNPHLYLFSFFLFSGLQENDGQSPQHECQETKNPNQGPNILPGP